MWQDGANREVAWYDAEANINKEAAVRMMPVEPRMKTQIWHVIVDALYPMKAFSLLPVYECHGLEPG